MLKDFVVDHERGFRSKVQHMFDGYLSGKIEFPSHLEVWINPSD